MIKKLSSFLFCFTFVICMQAAEERGLSDYAQALASLKQDLNQDNDYQQIFDDNVLPVSGEKAEQPSGEKGVPEYNSTAHGFLVDSDLDRDGMFEFQLDKLVRKYPGNLHEQRDSIIRVSNSYAKKIIAFEQKNKELEAINKELLVRFKKISNNDTKETNENDESILLGFYLELNPRDDQNLEEILNGMIRYKKSISNLDISSQLNRTIACLYNSINEQERLEKENNLLKAQVDQFNELFDLE